MRAISALMMLALGAAACGGDPPPVARPMPPPASTTANAGGGGTPTPPSPVPEPRGVPNEPLTRDELATASLDTINRNSPLLPVFFDYDSSEITAEGRKTLEQTAELLRQYSSWTITIEGHTDERGTAEYNLALGERRAVAAQSYLVSLGIAANRLRTVSYGKEFPFEPGHNEESWYRNRRAHFVVTAR